MAYQPPPQPKKNSNPPPVKKDNPKKDQGCHYCNVVGHWKRNCPLYLDELREIGSRRLGTWAPALQLKKLFPVSVAKGLVNLERLSIKYCVFKSVIAGEGETEQAFDLCRLAEISFYSLPHLESFSSGNFGIKYPELVKVSISGCSSMRLWGNGVHETPELKFVDDVPVKA
ncbi:NB-ARC domains-containing protein [Artemisia annua]|uniref:NB-ARC domains-containing protein n=1 Tax=Artemisia annua TaxID=35608 RepID=A0A2U1LSD3_ARTAN|nr:NB-ARC domains-containing protein [Artemisia annua]